MSNNISIFALIKHELCKILDFLGYRMSEIENKNKQSTALERDTLECQAHTNSHIHGLTHTQTRNDYLDKTKQTVH